VLAGIAIGWARPQNQLSSAVLVAIPGGFLAGFLAPVAKDLLAVLQKARGQ
jgi:hypothetical protein